jgi:hypothetical protein
MTFNLELISAIILIPLTVKLLALIIFMAYFIVTYHANDWEYGIALNAEPAIIGVECDILEPLLEDCLDQLYLSREFDISEAYLSHEEKMNELRESNKKTA